MKTPLRWQFAIVFVVAVVVVTAATTAVGVQQATANLQRSAVAQQQESGANAASGTRYVLEAAKRSLISSASIIPEGDLLPTPNEEALGLVLDPLLAFSQEYDAAYLLDSIGAPVVARPAHVKAAGTSFSDDATFLTAQRSGRPELSFEPGAGHAYWVTVVSSTRANAQPYYLLGVLKIDRLAEVLLSTIEPGDDAMIVSPDGLVIAQTRLLTDAPLVAWDPWIALRDDADTSSVRGSLPDGSGDVVVTRSELPSYPGASVFLVSAHSQIASLQHNLVRNAVVTAVALAATAGVVGVVAATRITAPLRDVRSAAHRMRSGDLTVRARPRGPPETRELAQDFNAMAEALGRDREALLQLQTGLEHRVVQRTEELRRKQEEMELFFYGVSHDFKSPVISIGSFAQLAQEALRDPKRHKAELREHLERIRQSSQTLQTLIGELLKFARAERMSPMYAGVDVDDAVAAVLAELGPIARDHGVDLQRVGPPLVMETDPDALRAILTNLVHNAVSYMPKSRRGRVAVQWHTRGGAELVLRVEDNGAGIPADVQTRLFRPFSRHQPRGVKTTGTGLGLSIVARLVEKLGGAVRLTSVEGEGTTVTVALPLRRPAPGDT